jgi:methionyl aminopeptidase
MIVVKSKREIDLMREAALKLQRVFAALRDMARSGVRTRDIDREAEACIQREKALPAFKGYRGYPAVVCASINEQVVHAIPCARKLKAGDILSLDIGLIWKDFYADSARTWPVGHISDEVKQLIRVTKSAMYEGKAKMRPGGRVGDISHAIQAFVEGRGYSVVRDFVGHGIGRQMHEDPQVPNFGEQGRGARLEVGMALALEPMVTQGSWQVDVQKDGWTVVTRDGAMAAHWEDTIALTESGPENLTGDQEDAALDFM